MRIPDWLIYTVVLIAIVYGLFSRSESNHAPPPPPPIDIDVGPILPGPSVFDESVLVQVDGPEDSTGTAFAIGSGGFWMTARHVVDGCDQVGIRTSPRQIALVQDVVLNPLGDLALLRTTRAPEPNELDVSGELRLGQPAFHIGYPQGRPGEVATRLLARSRLVTRGRFNSSAPVLAWAETGRSRGLSGTLGGLSGGPVFDSDGEVIGVTVAESPRRGRVYTAAPGFMAEFVSAAAVELDGQADGPITFQDYGEEADRLRRELSVVQIVCKAD